MLFFCPLIKQASLRLVECDDEWQVWLLRRGVVRKRFLQPFQIQHDRTSATIGKRLFAVLDLYRIAQVDVKLHTLRGIKRKLHCAATVFQHCLGTQLPAMHMNDGKLAVNLGLLFGGRVFGQ